MSSSNPRWRASIGAAVLVLAMLAGCAPHRAPVVELDAGARRTDFARALAGRSRLASSVQSDLSVWARSEVRDLPGVSARLWAVAPDAFRLRIESLFGTALDLSARGDSIAAYAPPRRAGLELEVTRDSLGIEDPGGLGLKLWSAGFEPPDEAWRNAAWADSMLRISWRQDSDSIAIDVGAGGLPRRVAFDRPGHGGFTVAYDRWAIHDGFAWPERVAIDVPERGWGLTFQTERVRFGGALDPGRLVVRIPPGAERLTRDAIERALRKLGSL